MNPVPLRNGSPAVPSDALARVYAMVETYPELARSLGGLRSVRLVIDASVVLADLRWLAGKRRNPTARTSLMEVMAAGTVVAYAPPELRIEVRKEIPSIAEELGISELEIVSLWQSTYEPQLNFHARGNFVPSHGSVRDPKDMPYIELWAGLGADAIYTRDNDIAAMGGHVVSAEIVLSLRDYARAASVEMTLKIGSAAMTLVGIEALRSVVGAVRFGVDAIRRAPRGVQLALLIGGSYLLINPKSRNSLFSMLSKIGEIGANASSAAAPMLARLLEMMNDAQQARERAWDATAQSFAPQSRAQIQPKLIDFQSGAKLHSPVVRDVHQFGQAASLTSPSRQRGRGGRKKRVRAPIAQAD